jgi:LuxR family maltose regulon positive regulatory protein
MGSNLSRHASVPAVRGGFIFRRWLFEQLGVARVTQVSAPAGSGKTVLLRCWAADSGLADSTAWVTVLGDDRDPQRFWISVADALRNTTVGSKLIRPLTAAPDLDGWAIVERLLEDLGPMEGPLWLVIDDVHELDSSQALRQLELLVMRAPTELRFVLATRSDVSLGLHRIRLEGELTEIRAAELRFTSDETRALLGAAGVTLPDAALELLHRRTEGWAAGLRLAALLLAGHPDPERFAAEFSGSERTVAEYLLAEVLDRQTPEVRRLLLRTSILEQVSGELADLLTGGSAGERILQDLEEAGAFVVSLDARRSWFRYHQLFADLLQLELRRTQPTELRALHSTAAGWYAEHGRPVEAVRHAQAARDWGLATRLLSDNFLSLALDGQGATAHELLAEFPADALTADAELAAMAANDQMLRGSLEAAEQYLARAIHGSGTVPADRRGRFEAELAVTRLSVARERGDLPAVVEEAQRLLDRTESLPTPGASRRPDAARLAKVDGEDLRALALVSLGMAELWALRAPEAERHLEQGGAMADRIGRPWLEVTALAHGAWAASFRSFGLAIGRSAQAIKLAREHGWTEEPVVAVAYVALGAIRIWQMRLEEAEALLDRASRAFRAEAEPAAGLVLHQAHGMLELGRGRDAAALTEFRTAERLAALLVTEHPRTTPMRAHMLQTLVRLGDTGQAGTTLDGLDGLDGTERGELRNALAALRLAQGDPRAATVALAPVLGGSAPVTNLGWMTEAFLLEAIARDALDDHDAAGRALEHALDLAEPDGVILAFALHPAPELLKRHARRHTAHAALISEILHPRGTEGGELRELRESAGRIASPRTTLREPLTDSEMRVLRYLPTNLPAPEIANELSLSVNTVRTHIRHLYEKLTVHSRSQAVDQARALGLLAPSSRRP